MFKITICTCASRPYIDKGAASKIAAECRRNGASVRVLDDMCLLAMQATPEANDIASSDYILACNTRAVRSLFDRIGMATGAKIINMREEDYSSVIAALRLPLSETDAAEAVVSADEEGEAADAWFPVIDKLRCSNCGRCHDFCLFGVYESESGQVQVAKPQNCKYNCPACARMCPKKAIIFPKYEKSPINGGTTDDEVFDPAEMDNIYRERLRMRLEQRKKDIPLTKNKER